MGTVITSKYDIFVSHQFDYIYLEKVADIHSPTLAYVSSKRDLVTWILQGSAVMGLASRMGGKDSVWTAP